jgi:hypothetical protein
MQNHEQNKKLEKIENPRVYGQNKQYFCLHVLLSLGSFSYVAAYRSSPKTRGKMNLQPILDKNLPQAYMELEFDKLGIAIKLLKYLVHLSKRKNGN